MVCILLASSYGNLSSKYLELSAVLLYVINNVYWIEIRLKIFAPRVGVVVNMTTDPGA